MFKIRVKIGMELLYYKVALVVVIFNLKQAMDNQVSLHNKNVTVVLVDHSAHLVQLVHLNMTSDMAIANHVKTYH